MISEFQGEYRWLSNFWSAVVYRGQLEFPTVEHAYQSAKFTDIAHIVAIQKASTPGVAKSLARKYPLREDWDTIKTGIMEDLLRQKFKSGSVLAANLVATGEQELEEGNLWHDMYWGVCHCYKHKGNGKNVLGKLLMQIRNELIADV